MEMFIAIWFITLQKYRQPRRPVKGEPPGQIRWCTRWVASSKGMVIKHHTDRRQHPFA